MVAVEVVERVAVHGGSSGSSRICRGVLSPLYEEDTVLFVDLRVSDLKHTSKNDEILFIVCSRTRPSRCNVSFPVELMEIN